MDPLLENKQNLLKTEGSSLNKGILQFYSCLESLAGKKSDICFYEASLLTHILKDALGGNSYTVGIVCLN